MYRLSRRPVTARIQAMCIAEVSRAKSAEGRVGQQAELVARDNRRLQPADGNVFAPF